MDPLQAGVNFILGRMKASAFYQWMRFLFELIFSGVVSFLFIGGSVMISTKSGILGVGSGMVAAAISMVALFRRESSKLTKGMLIILPEKEATQELSENLQTIEKK